MNKQLLLGSAFLFAFLRPAPANPLPLKAIITGGGGSGRCTIEVTVDHAAEIEVSGDRGLLTTTAGQPADWRRFQCNMPLPRNPGDFHLVKTGGRGAVRLVQDPRGTGGRAVIQVQDPQGGRGKYTFDLRWQGSREGGWAPGPPPGVPPGPPNGPGPGPWPGGGFPMAKAIGICQGSVTDRLTRDGYSYVTFERTIPDNNPGRRDWVVGTASAKRDWRTARFSFSCSVDFSSGRVRSVDVRRR